MCEHFSDFTLNFKLIPYGSLSLIKSNLKILIRNQEEHENFESESLSYFACQL